MMKVSATRTKILSRLEDRLYIRDLPLLIALLAGLALRLQLWGRLPRTGLVSDEGEYLSAASWLAHGHGFDWYQGYLWTRAPLYPLFLAAHLRLFGDSLAPIYATQTLLSLVNVALVYFLAQSLTTDDRRPGDSATRRPGDSEQHAIRNTQHASQFWIPGLAALLMALYFPFASYSQVLLSETLFITLLLGGFLALARWKPDDGRRTTDDGRQGGKKARSEGAWAWFYLPVSLSLRQLVSPVVAAGALFGLATLTRSLTLLFLPIVALWILWRSRPVRKGVLCALLFLACCGVLILPWTIYNSRLYGGLVLVDTSGAFNLLLGGRTAYDGKRNDAPPRNFVLALLDRNLQPDQRLTLLEDQRASDGQVLMYGSCLYRGQDPRLLSALNRPAEQITQAGRQQLMTAEGLCLIGARPTAFLAKSLGELIDLFQINYSGDERFTDGFTTGRPPPWYTLALFLLDDTLYVLALPLAIIGWALARRTTTDDRTGTIYRARTVVGLIGLWWLYNIALAPLLFAINRFRLPLLPFAFIFAAYALAALPRGGWRGLRSRSGLIWAALAALLALVAVTPYAYLQPNADSTDADQNSWASYLGPLPSSLAGTQKALAARPVYLRSVAFRQALHDGDAAAARAIMRAGEVRIERGNKKLVPDSTLAQALLAALDERHEDGLNALPPADEIVRARDVEAAVVLGDLLRSLGRLDKARAAFTPMFVDSANPVQWAWDWLHPAPTRTIDLAGNLDLGYVEGCYLGEGDTSLKPPATFRWCTDGARLRFPGAGAGAPQTLVLRADGRGWLPGWLPVPPVRVFLGDQEAGSFTPDHNGIGDFSIALPPTPRGADVIITLRTPTFIPDAARYLSQQGGQVGQAQRLGVRLDWAELRDTAP
jgi:4-amino-4-deoxy-L-arabinose transferase-like glycosyltransferase